MGTHSAGALVNRGGVPGVAPLSRRSVPAFNPERRSSLSWPLFGVLFVRHSGCGPLSPLALIALLKNCGRVGRFPTLVVSQVDLAHFFRQRSLKLRYQIIYCWDETVVVIHWWPVLLPTSRRHVRQQLIQVSAHLFVSCAVKVNAGGKGSFKAVKNVEVIDIAIILSCLAVEEINEQT